MQRHTAGKPLDYKARFRHKSHARLIKKGCSVYCVSHGVCIRSVLYFLSVGHAIRGFICGNSGRGIDWATTYVLLRTDYAIPAFPARSLT